MSIMRRSPVLGPVAIFVVVILVMDAVALVAALRQVWDGPMANDWISFYTGGTLARSSAAHLYDASSQSGIQRALLGAEFKTHLGFLLPAFVAFFFAPLSKLSFAMSYTVWMGINIIVLGLLLRLSWRWLEALPQPLRTVFLASAVTVPGTHVLVHGQVDFFVLVGLAGCYALLRAGRPALAGSVLALALCKPHLAGAVLLLLLVNRQWRALAAFAGAGGILLLAPALFAGPGVLIDQARLLFSFNSGTTNELVLPLDTMINIRATATSITGSSNVWLWMPLLICITAVALAAALRVWFARPALHPQSWALAFTLPLLYSPHVHVQSLVLLIAAAGLYLVARQASRSPVVDVKYPLLGLVVLTVLWSLSVSGGPSLMALVVIGACVLFSQRWPEPVTESVVAETARPVQLALAS